MSTPAAQESIAQQIFFSDGYHLVNLFRKFSYLELRKMRIVTKAYFTLIENNYILQCEFLSGYLCELKPNAISYKKFEHISGVISVELALGLLNRGQGTFFQSAIETSQLDYSRKGKKRKLPANYPLVVQTQVIDLLFQINEIKIAIEVFQNLSIVSSTDEEVIVYLYKKLISHKYYEEFKFIFSFLPQEKHEKFLITLFGKLVESRFHSVEVFLLISQFTTVPPNSLEVAMIQKIVASEGPDAFLVTCEDDGMELETVELPSLTITLRDSHNKRRTLYSFPLTKIPEEDRSKFLRDLLLRKIDAVDVASIKEILNPEHKKQIEKHRILSMTRELGLLQMKDVLSESSDETKLSTLDNYFTTIQKEDFEGLKSIISDYEIFLRCQILIALLPKTNPEIYQNILRYLDDVIGEIEDLPDTEMEEPTNEYFKTKEKKISADESDSGDDTDYEGPCMKKRRIERDPTVLSLAEKRAVKELVLNKLLEMRKIDDALASFWKCHVDIQRNLCRRFTEKLLDFERFEDASRVIEVLNGYNKFWYKKLNKWLEEDKKEFEARLEVVGKEKRILGILNTKESANELFNLAEKELFSNNRATAFKTIRFIQSKNLLILSSLKLLNAASVRKFQSLSLIKNVF